MNPLQLVVMWEVKIMSLVVDENINDIKLEDIPKSMPMRSFIGRTVEKLLYKGELIEIKFTDGTYGLISNAFPITHYGRDVYKKHCDKGELNMCGFCYNSDGSSNELWECSSA